MSDKRTKVPFVTDREKELQNRFDTFLNFTNTNLSSEKYVENLTTKRCVKITLNGLVSPLRGGDLQSVRLKSSVVECPPLHWKAGCTIHGHLSDSP